MKVFSQKKMSLEEVQSPGAHMFLITGAQTCPLSCQRLEASACECVHDHECKYVYGLHMCVITRHINTESVS